MDPASKAIAELAAEFEDSLPLEFEFRDEKSRSYHLVFHVLGQILEMPIGNLRNFIDCTGSLGLLEFNELAETDFDKSRKEDSSAKQLFDLLVRSGQDDDIAETAVRGLCDLSRGLANNYRGKAQVFLQKYAEIMVEELLEKLPISGVNEEARRRIFTLWLQNTLNLPILEPGEESKYFCEKKQLSLQEIKEAANLEDISLTTIDDLLKFKYYEDSIKSE